LTRKRTIATLYKIVVIIHVDPSKRVNFMFFYEIIDLLLLLLSPLDNMKRLIAIYSCGFRQ